MHLHAERPAACAAFFELVQQARGEFGALYVLGDLFEVWLGDDDRNDDVHARTLESLRAFSDAGGALYVMHGNRDFLIGEGFREATGATLLDDPCLVTLHGVPTLLMHGDLLCTDDLRYQMLRTQVRNPDWQRGFLARPLAERQAMAAAVRRENETEKSRKTDEIMDVTESAVQDHLRRFGYPRLVHGHTHRPARHLHEVDGRQCERWVLPDWYHEGGYIVSSSDGLHTRTVPGAPW